MNASLNQGFLQQSSRIANADGSPTHAFFHFLLSLWKKTGSGFVANINAAYIQQSPTGAGAPLEVHKAQDGSLIGTIPIVNVPGAPAVPLVVGASPFVYHATRDGTLISLSGQMELSRNAGVTWYQFSLTGGAIPVLKDDRIRVTWYDASSPPLVTFFPIGGA